MSPHILGTFPRGQGVPRETTQQRHARLYPGAADLRERPRYYVTKAKADREYLKVWPKRREAAACAIAGNPNSLSSTSVSPDYLFRKCRRVTVPLEMPEPWRSLLIPLSIGLTEAAIDDLFSPATPCPTCGFNQRCDACRARITERHQAQLEQTS